MAEWIKGAIKRPGAFRAKAQAAGMSTAAYARKVLADGSRASDRTKRQARLAQTLSRLRNRIVAAACALGPAGSEVLWNTGWTDEARASSLAVRQAKARQKRKERDAMFAEQQQRGGDDFIENWYPRGRDGKYQDPHYGRTSREAPYGYVDGTDTPRKEPLYDRYGRPIIPRTRDEYTKPEMSGMWPFQKDTSLGRDLYWMGKVERAEKTWGPFGRKKRFMDEHPGASEEDWKKYDREQYERWKQENGVESQHSDKGAKPKK